MMPKSLRWKKKLLDGAKVALGVSSTVAVGGGLAAGCLDRPLETNSPRTTSTVVDVLTQSSVDKIDLLLVIDNSGSMADKQDILAVAVPKLVQRLVQPQCVDSDGLPASPAVSIDGEGKCPDGYKPEFEPVQDINIGVVSSSIGAAGASSLCSRDPASPNYARNNDDLGQLIWRTRPCRQGDDNCPNDAPTYENIGFLAWDPQQKRPCPGQPAGGDVCPGSNDAAGLISTLTSMVVGVGEFGCGYEAPLEAAYRFLVDPEPYLSIAGGVTEGVDETILDQRKAFLRPDSLVAVILLTDENDCSLRQDQIGDFMVDSPIMPRPRSECATDPDDPCCKSCIEDPGDCGGDGGCEVPGCQDAGTCPGNFYPEDGSGEPEDFESDVRTRCADQKRRFGLDFLTPVDRYVNAFSSTLINPGKLDLAPDGKNDVQNPLFTDLQDLGRPVRQSDLVFVAGIAGVPWQLIARKNEAGEPDLKAGLDAEGLPVGGFQTYEEMETNGVWNLIIPENGADYADDPLMIESRSPRAGLSTDRDSNPINGNEWTTDNADLQYACIFDLPQPSHTDCAANPDDCGTDCNEADNPGGKPLCTGATGQTQNRAKAYPSTRVFQVLHGLGEQGISASICPAQLALAEGQSVDDKDFGYTPAVFAIIDRLKTKLGGSCQPRQLTADAEGNVPCLVIEARDSDGDRKSDTDGKCNCDGTGRQDIRDESKAAADKIRNDLSNEEPSPGYDCLCEIVQLSGSPDDEGSDRYHCQNDENPPNDVNGWCYVDAASVPPVGNPDLVANCPASERRLVRFVNEGEVSPGARLYITCAGE